MKKNALITIGCIVLGIWLAVAAIGSLDHGIRIINPVVMYRTVDIWLSGTTKVPANTPRAQPAITHDRSKPPSGWKILTDGERFRWQDSMGFIDPIVFPTRKKCIAEAWRWRELSANWYENIKGEWKEVEE